MAISLSSEGSWGSVEKFLKNAASGGQFKILSRYGEKGVSALSAASPKDSGTMASSWSYEVELGVTKSAIYWSNSNEEGGVNIAVIIQHGHGTGTGGYVQGRDFINPAMRPIFDEIANAVWMEVTR